MKLELNIKNRLGDSSSEKDAKGRAAVPQGISASGSALRGILSTALILLLIPLFLGIAYLFMMREPAMQEANLNRIASAYTQQQATNVQDFVTSVQQRLEGSISTPLARAALTDGSASAIAPVEESLLRFFPEAIEVRIVPVGDMGTAEFVSGQRGLRNHIEMDLVRQASNGRDTEPESYKFEDRWLTSLAAKVDSDGREDLTAVILLTFDNKQLKKRLQSNRGDAGEFILEQRIPAQNGKPRSQKIASVGEGYGSDTWYADVADTTWRVGFTPSKTLIDELKFNKLPLYAVLAISLLAAIIAIGFVAKRFPRVLSRDANAIIEGADRKSELLLSVPELVPVAKQLRRATLRALRQSQGTVASPPPQQMQVETLDDSSAELASPLFQSTTMLDDELEEGILDLDLADDLPAAMQAADSGLPEHIFRAYDIRGNARNELTDELITQIGKAIGTIAEEQGQSTLIIACDGRSSSPRIKSALARALMETGRDIVDIGMVPTPLLYFATHHLEYTSGVMITGSHNPPDDNGLKIVIDGQTIAAGGIREIRDRIVKGDFAAGNGRLIREDVVPAYIDELVQDIAIAVPLKIVIDAGNGVTSEIAPELFRELGCEVIPLYCDIDGSFPNHPPDTSNENNLESLVRTVKDVHADFGVAFDGDGDRLAVVTSSGRIVRTDVLMMLYAQDVVSRNPGADVVFDVKCSRNLTNLITHHGGRPVLWKTGHAFMKEKMRETGALLGGEFSGHIFFGERWFGFDDGMYAAARLAEIMSTQGDSLDDAIDEFPSTVDTPEIIIPVPDSYKFQLVEKIVNNADFSSGKVNTMDGIRVDFSDGWGLVRASNTGPALTARFEADTTEHLELIQDEFRAQIALIDPKVELNF